ncbi:MAG: hypothetical protein IJD80_03800 [Oscillospiraceae bacterium]|nr:hypothetical protein [Oscillospiraceae bacterium]
MKTFDFDIDKREVLRYAGHKNGDLPKGLDRLTDEIIRGCKDSLMPKNVVRRYRIEMVENGVMLSDIGFMLQGNDIKKHLEGCDECYVMCATVGTGADGFIRTMLAMDTVRGMLADAAATAAVESYCDMLETRLRNQLKAENRFLTWRYSPGYGDFPFIQQPDILSLLQADKYTGVTCNESCIMIPSKSVTAIMGIASVKPVDRRSKCESCPNKENCNFSCRQG